MSHYARIRCGESWDKTWQFWNVHRLWTYFVPMVLGIAVGVGRYLFGHEYQIVRNAGLVGVIVAAGSYVVGWVGSFLINYIWITPEDLYSKQHAEITGLIAKNEEARREFIAAHETMKGELAAEREKNARPDIRGEAFNFVAGMHGDTVDKISCHATIQFQLSLCNHRRVPTNLKTIELDGGEMKIPAKFSGDVLAELRAGHRPRPPKPELPFGLETAVAWSAEMEIADHWFRDIRDLDLAGLKIYVVDGFGDPHPIQVRLGEVLFPQ